MRCVISGITIAVLLILAVAKPAEATNECYGQMGSAVQLLAGVNVVTYLSEGVVLTLTAAAQGAVTVSPVNSPPTPLCTGCVALPLGMFGSTCGYTIASTGGAISNVQFVTGALFFGATNPINVNAPVGCLRSSANGYTYIALSTYSALTNKVTAQLTGAGTYIFAAVQSNIAASLGSAVRLAAYSAQTITFGSSVALQLASSVASNALVCTTSTVPTVGAAVVAQAGTSIGAFINFGGQTAGPYTGVVSYVYTAAQLAAANCDLQAGSNLIVAFYDAAGCGCWITPSSGLSLNAAQMRITQTVSGAASGSVILPAGVFCTNPQTPPPPPPPPVPTYPPLPVPAVCPTDVLGSVLTFGGAFSVSGIVSGSASAATRIAVSVLDSAPAPIPNGCTGVEFASSVGGGVGLAIRAANSAAYLSNVVVTTPPCTAASIQALASAGNTPACFVLNTATRVWTRVAVTAYNAATGQCTFNCGSACAQTSAEAALVIVAAASASVPAP